MTLISLAITLFLIMDPIGNIASFLKLLDNLDPAKRRKIIAREMLIALSVMIVFNIFGEYIFDLLDVSVTTVRLASGAILFLVAVKILFPSLDSPRANLPTGEPFITPIAIPLIAGPALLASIMLFAKLEDSQPVMWAAIFIAWAAAVVVMLSAKRLQSLLGTNGLLACERLIGMILLMLAIQRFLEGVKEFVGLCHK
jgi:multiple antibiotic resistance protein